jgi:anti-anti-sigma regulatory factor
MLTRVTPGDHACAAFDSDQQLAEIASDFVADGLMHHEKVCFLDDEGAADAMLRRLSEDLGDAPSYLASGQLAIVPQEATRASFQGPAEDLLDVISESITAALDQGMAGFRLTGQLTGAAQRSAGISLADYDLALDRIWADCPVSVLCPYDSRRLPAVELEQLRGLHRIELIAPAIFDDGLLRITQSGRFGLRLAGEVDHSNRSTVRGVVESALDSALRSTERSDEVRLNLTSLRFLDVAAAYQLVQAAEAFPISHRLVLAGVRPMLQRLLDRCGAAFAPQLAIIGSGRS